MCRPRRWSRRRRSSSRPAVGSATETVWTTRMCGCGSPNTGQRQQPSNRRRLLSLQHLPLAERSLARGTGLFVTSGFAGAARVTLVTCCEGAARLIERYFAARQCETKEKISPYSKSQVRVRRFSCGLALLCSRCYFWLPPPSSPRPADPRREGRWPATGEHRRVRIHPRPREQPQLSFRPTKGTAGSCLGRGS